LLWFPALMDPPHPIVNAAAPQIRNEYSNPNRMTVPAKTLEVYE